MNIDPNKIESDVRYEELKLRAELYSTLYNVSLQAPNRKLSNFSRATYKRVLRRTYPWIWTRETVHSYPDLYRGLKGLWGEIPKFCLFVPVLETAPQTTVILGCAHEPRADQMSYLLLTVSKAIRSRNQSFEDIDTLFKVWAEHPSPTIVVQENHCVPYLNNAAKSLLQNDHPNDLSDVLGSDGYEYFVEKGTTEGLSSFQFRFTFSIPGKDPKVIEANVTRIAAGLSLILTDFGPQKVIEETKSKLIKEESVSENFLLPGSISNVEAIVSSSTVIKQAKRVLFYLHGEAFPPIPVGLKMSMTLGRDVRNDVVLPDSLISRFHAGLKVRGDTVTLEDLGSSNGVLINGERRSQASVSIGDHIKIGAYEFTVQASDLRAQNGENHGKAPPHPSRARTKQLARQSLERALNSKIAFSGRLESLSLFVIGSLIEQQAMSGTLRIHDGKAIGEIDFAGGQVTFAKASKKTSKAALKVLLQLPRGRFEFEERPSEGEGGHFGRTFTTMAKSLIDDVTSGA
ncbi:MAG: FHA domain-containing protein [Planctomycetota bacterium]|nr:FHA domain-containing protein [Planctomycetota bacterium]